ncbi:MAG: acyl-CoA dehydrogenase family protein [Thermodesulfobacteriota bacterium]|jgi:alkylation response protein AidB-like acyl-CoA dehydrogenase
MNFGFTEDQEMLRDTARKFLDAECPTTFVRKMMADDTAHATELWKKIARLGWLGINVPEEFGGSGGSFIDLIVILEEMGKSLLPGPFFATAVFGSAVLVTGGSAEQKAALLPRVVDGDVILSVALAEKSGRYDAAGVTMMATPKGGDFLLSGEKMFVPDAHVADHIVVAARTAQEGNPEEGITLFLVDAKAPGVTVTQLKTVDMTRRQCHVAFQEVGVPGSQVIGEVGRGWPILRRVLDVAMTGLCAEMVGTGQKALDMAVAYAKERVQFGKPIGSFQAVKHKCVDMMVQVENARSLTYYAAWAVDENVPEARQAVPMAKAYCSDMCKTVTSEAIQVHGGIGFTWEHDMHLFYRRALASEAAFGSAPVHREVVAQTLNL